MHPARRHVPSLLALLAATATLLAACGGGGNRTAVVNGPSQSAGPETTGTPSPTASATASPQPTATPSPTPAPTPPPPGPSVQPTPYYIPPGDQQGALHAGQYLFPSSTGVACGDAAQHYDNCPVTARLAQRLDGNPTPGAKPLCRCQNVYQSSAVTAEQSSDPSVWTDHVVLTFGPGATVKIDLLVRRTAAGWLADDTTCTGEGSSTSIYGSTPPPCPG